MDVYKLSIVSFSQSQLDLNREIKSRLVDNYDITYDQDSRSGQKPESWKLDCGWWVSFQGIPSGEKMNLFGLSSPFVLKLI